MIVASQSQISKFKVLRCSKGQKPFAPLGSGDFSALRLLYFGDKPPMPGRLPIRQRLSNEPFQTFLGQLPARRHTSRYAFAPRAVWLRHAEYHTIPHSGMPQNHLLDQFRGNFASGQIHHVPSPPPQKDSAVPHFSTVACLEFSIAKRRRGIRPVGFADSL